MSYVQPSMFGEYPDQEVVAVPRNEIWIEIRPGWRTVSSRTRNLGWHKIKHKTPYGVVTVCGRNGFVHVHGKDPEWIHPCLECLELEDE